MAPNSVIMDDLEQLTSSIKNVEAKPYLLDAVIEALDKLGHAHADSVDAACKFFGVRMQ